MLLPAQFFALIDMDIPNYIFIWQALGMVVGVYGIGYYLASYDYIKDRNLILVGFLGKLFGPVGTIMYILKGELPAMFLWLNVFNDIIWLIPFGIMLCQAYKPLFNRQDYSNECVINRCFTEEILFFCFAYLFLFTQNQLPGN
ncbi:MAG: alkyl hydroperoxide reductase [Cytophagales bacterium]|nr:alkyl hydroperoxide reductase [Cytophaga sp.]